MIDGGLSSWLLSALRPIFTAVQAVMPRIKVILAEKSAAEAPHASLANSQALKEQFEDCLARLGNIPANQSWWRRITRCIETQFVQPELFAKPAVREWLSKEPVQAGLFQLARETLQKRPLSENTKVELRAAYSDATGEAARFADVAIDIVIAVFVAGRTATLNPGQQVLMDGLQGNSQQITDLANKVGRSSPNPVIDEAIRQELRKIRRRRMIPGIDVRSEVRALLGRIENGDLTSASQKVVGEILLWAARLHAGNSASEVAADNYLKRFEDIIPNSSDAAIVKALLLFNSGKAGDALQLLKGNDTADARSVVLTILYKHKGDKAALDWFKLKNSGCLDFFSPSGWCNLAVLYYENQQWDASVKILEDLPETDIVENPYIPYVLGIFHAGFLLPESCRQKALTYFLIEPELQVNEGEEAELHRAAAITRLRQARDLLLEIDAHNLIKQCNYWLLWLGLSNPATRDESAKHLRQQMAAGAEGLLLMDLAINYNIEFDHGVADQHFRVREMEGGLTPREHVARIAFLRYRKAPQLLLDYLDTKSDQLKDFIAPARFALMRVEALIADGRQDEAESILDQYPDLNDDPEAARARLVISDRRGQDVCGDLIRLYEQNRDHDDTGHQLSDLKNIVRLSEREKRWQQMLPYARELFERERTATNLDVMTNCSYRVHGTRAALEILKANSDLVKIDRDIGRHLMERKVNFLFHLGLFRDACAINNELLAVLPNEPQYIHHDMNIALRSGAWEHFPAVLDRQLARRESLDLSVLMRLVWLIRDTMPDEAMKLLKIAAERELEDPQIQLACYMQACAIGRERDAASWLKLSIELSKDGEGPVHSTSLAELVDMAPAHAQAQNEKHRQLLSGEVSLHMASIGFCIPMSRLFITIPRTNEQEQDARKRHPIAIRSGNRPPISLGLIRTISFDVSTLLLLEELGLFDALMSAVEHIKVSPRLMDFLAREIRDLPYHQPSLVDGARALLRYVSERQIAVLTSEAVDASLVAEFGDEMARLVAAARSQGGRVIALAQMCKIGSLEEKSADWGAAAPLVLSTVQLAEGMRHLGYIDQRDCDEACQFLKTQDRGTPPGPGMSVEQSLFIDNLALQYLIEAGLLDKLARCRIPLFIDHSTEQKAHDLIRADDEGRGVAETLQALRRRIAECYRQDSLSFLPESTVETDGKWPEKDDRMLMLYDLLSGVEAVDAVALDDRWSGRFSNATDTNGRTVPLLGITDLLSLPGITDEQRLDATRHLWRRGFAFLPLHEINFLNDLKNCYWDDATEKFRETAELRAVRETLCRIRSLNMLRIGEDQPWLDHLAQTAAMTVLAIWRDETITEPKARAFSSWLIDNVTPWPVDWQDSLAEGHWTNLDLAMAQRLFQLLILAPYEASRMRQAAYQNWADERLVQPFRATNPDIIDMVSQFLAQHFAQVVTEIPDESED